MNNIDSSLFKSQQEEDKIIYNEIFKNIKIDNGIYFEMGAMNGIEYSNTYFFEKYLNWSGILVEPHPFNFKNLQKNRPNNILFNNLVSNEKEKQLFMYYDKFTLSGVSGIINTLPKKNIETYFEQDHPWQNELRKKNLKKEFIVPVTLQKIIDESNVDHIDFFILDVEGHELQVLQSFNFTIPINVMLIENNQDTFKINQMMTDKDFVFIKYIGCNSLFLNKYFISKHKYLHKKYLIK